MRGIRKLLGVFVFIMVAILLPNRVFAEDIDTDEVIKKISPDMENAIFNIKKPTNMEEEYAVNYYVSSLIGGDDYDVQTTCEEPYNTCTIDITSLDFSSSSYWDDEKQGMVEETTGWRHSYNINVKFNEPKSNKYINDYINKLNEFDPTDPSTYYIVEDLSLINYYLTSNKSELWNNGAAGRALKYSTINDVIKGSNISFSLEIGAGNQDETLMFESAFGEMSIFYKGYSYGTKQEGLYLRRVIYIPESTSNDKDSYIDAAQKRINDYLGNDSVKVTYGGLLSSLPEDSEDPDYPVESDGNYYNVKVGNRTYKFYIVKGTDKQLKEPVYNGIDLDSQIQIESDDSNIPLDTALTVNYVNDSSIKDIIGTDNYKSYDITLYSAAKGEKIETLDNGKFLVKIPVPKELEGKDLIVYYVNGKTKEEHSVTVKDGYAIFETNHFSTYTLAEKSSSSSIDNPNTFDNINSIIRLLIISIISIVSLTTIKNKKFNIN